MMAAKTARTSQKEYRFHLFGRLSVVLLAEILFFSPCWIFPESLGYIADLPFWQWLAIANASLGLIYGLTRWLIFPLFASLGWSILLAVAHLPLKSWLLWGIENFPQLTEQYRINNWPWFFELAKPYLIQLAIAVIGSALLVHLILESLRLGLNVIKTKKKAE
ncbi:MAG TPA: hypothetical protein PLU50_08465 [Pseudobdellovibrionaceae bacterium]|nr:hypothetical protein [Pseudobdellovibrionaceae bacterium]